MEELIQQRLKELYEENEVLKEEIEWLRGEISDIVAEHSEYKDKIWNLVREIENMCTDVKHDAENTYRESMMLLDDIKSLYGEI